MGKYYVACGTLEVIVQADNPQQAVCTALDQANKNDELDDDIIVDERGFRYSHKKVNKVLKSDVLEWLYENDKVESEKDLLLIPQYGFSLEDFMEIMGDDDDDDDFEDE